MKSELSPGQGRRSSSGASWGNISGNKGMGTSVSMVIPSSGFEHATERENALRTASVASCAPNEGSRSLFSLVLADRRPDTRTRTRAPAHTRTHLNSRLQYYRTILVFSVERERKLRVNDRTPSHFVPRIRKMETIIFHDQISSLSFSFLSSLLLLYSSLSSSSRSSFSFPPSYSSSRHLIHFLRFYR